MIPASSPSGQLRGPLDLDHRRLAVAGDEIPARKHAGRPRLFRRDLGTPQAPCFCRVAFPGVSFNPPESSL